MKLGIKASPEKQSIKDLEETNAPFAEVWFLINKKDNYNDIFSYLAKKKIETGLHFWGLTHDGFIPTLAHNDPSFLRESMSLMKQTIDVAYQHNFSYVNIHPGFRTKVSCDFTKLIFTCRSLYTAPFDQATDCFLESVEQLSAYATERKVILTVETTPIRLQTGSLHDTSQRKSAADFAQYSFVALPTDKLHFAIANDFGHTAAKCISQETSPVWDFLYKKTAECAPKTRLLHLGFIVPPYNGTDFHEQLDNPVFETPEAVPNKKHMIELLKLFKNRDDVWALVEPNGQHPKNYFLAQKLLADAGL